MNFEEKNHQKKCSNHMYYPPFRYALITKTQCRGLKHVALLQTCTVSIFHFLIPPPTLGVGGWGYTHVALFMYTVFHINLFQLEYYVSVRYNRADITSSLMNVMHVALQTRGKIHFLEHIQTL